MNESVFQFALSRMPDPVLMIDDQHRIRWVNTKAVDVIEGGKTLLGKQACEIFSYEDQDRFVNALERSRHQGTPLTIGIGDPLKLGTRERVPVEVSVSEPCCDTDPVQRILVLHNVTKSREAIRKIRTYEDKLRQNSKVEALGRLTGGIAHDFNNVLTTIIGFSELTEAMLPEDSEARNLVHEIHEAGERASGIVRQLMAFSRQNVMSLQLVEVNTHVTGMKNLISTLVGADITLEIRLFHEDLVIKADPSQFEQVLLNLAANARDAIPGEGWITLSLERGHTSDQREAAVLKFQDDGMGMDASVVESIFDPFFTTKGLGEGTGLGLSTVHGIVKQLGGEIDVTSELGEGTTFMIRFPLVRQKHVPLASLENPAEMSLPRGTEEILFVEDLKPLRKLVRKALTGLGYSVTTASDGLEAIEVLGETPNRFSLVITDVIMPKMGGLELSEEIRRLRPGTKVLFISGYIDRIREFNQVIRPGVGFLAKPFDAAGLARAVREILGGEALPDRSIMNIGPTTAGSGHGN